MINLNYQSSDTSLLPSDFQLEDYKKIARDSKKRFLQFCFSNAEIPDQGFKIHISATQINYQVILDEVFDLCKSNLIDFYRYGRLKGPDKWIYNPITKLKEYRDYESMEYRLPAWVDEPFPDNSDDSKTCKYLFKKIMVQYKFLCK
ncbi:MAG: hypothetical protein SOH91_04780 [Lactobacillus delbrueckii]